MKLSVIFEIGLAAQKGPLDLFKSSIGQKILTDWRLEVPKKQRGPTTYDDKARVRWSTGGAPAMTPARLHEPRLAWWSAILPFSASTGSSLDGLAAHSSVQRISPRWEVPESRLVLHQ
ncbi:hypothetical protein [Bradyrhizobium macuxiense]|uniref:hypothetical protein n=1 Tax=Bradyrhizobium macuxiense TaxID=1755647 RepID=UPI0011BD70DA|nr:hypothetical protein [Bradyrhizobium macuxiense]